jgi:hypothetical protein
MRCPERETGGEGPLETMGEQRFDIGEGSLSRRGVAFPGFELGQDGVAAIIAGFGPDPRPPSVGGCGRGIQRTASIAAGEAADCRYSESALKERRKETQGTRLACRHWAPDDNVCDAGRTAQRPPSTAYPPFARTSTIVRRAPGVVCAFAAATERRKRVAFGSRSSA